VLATAFRKSPEGKTFNPKGVRLTCINVDVEGASDLLAELIYKTDGIRSGPGGSGSGGGD
jgi:hypothetical protein